MGLETTSYPDAVIFVDKATYEPLCTLKDPITGDRYQIVVRNDVFLLFKGRYHEYKETNVIPYEVWETLRSLNAPTTYNPKVEYTDPTSHVVEAVAAVSSDGDVGEEQFKEFLTKLEAEKNGLKSPFSAESRAGLVGKAEMPEHWISNAAQRRDTQISTTMDPDVKRELENKHRTIQIKSR